MTIKDISKSLKEIAHLHYAEDFDNVGLLTGEYDWECTGVLVTLDCLENTIDEAIARGCNMVVAFHPIIFSGLKNLQPSNYVKRTVVKAIKNDVAIYAVHTALDNAYNGVSYRMAKSLGLKDIRTLIPRSGIIKKILFYVPQDYATQVQEALYKVGAGELGNYSECSFTVQGKGSFKGNQDSNPFTGEKNVRKLEDEAMVSLTYLPHLEREVLQALEKTHPYEQVAYEITTLENSYQNIGMGAIGELEQPLESGAFLESLKTTFGTKIIRHTLSRKRNIQKIAVLGGSGAFGIQKAIAQKADAYVTSDLKYHDFFLGADTLLCDVGHYESEQFTIDLIYDFLNAKFCNIAIFCAQAQTNPVNYY
ncbi:MAG: Nif3-like dinuclear metal center hexameric protein [Nonlabens sp.]